MAAFLEFADWEIVKSETAEPIVGVFLILIRERERERACEKKKEDEGGSVYFSTLAFGS